MKSITLGGLLSSLSFPMISERIYSGIFEMLDSVTMMTSKTANIVISLNHGREIGTRHFLTSLARLYNKYRKSKRGQTHFDF